MKEHPFAKSLKTKKYADNRRKKYGQSVMEPDKNKQRIQSVSKGRIERSYQQKADKLLGNMGEGGKIVAETREHGFILW